MLFLTMMSKNRKKKQLYFISYQTALNVSLIFKCLKKTSIKCYLKLIVLILNEVFNFLFYLIYKDNNYMG